MGRALRDRTRLILRIGGVIMVLADAWVMMYGLAELLPRFGVRALDEVLFSSSRLQGSISSATTDWGTPVLVTSVSLVVAAVALVFALARRDARRAIQRHAPLDARHPESAISTSAEMASGDAGGRERKPIPRALTATPDVLDAVREAASGR